MHSCQNCQMFSYKKLFILRQPEKLTINNLHVSTRYHLLAVG